jgi:hypothetical protein
LLSHAAKIQILSEIQNIFAKNFGSSQKSSTFAGDFEKITCEDGLHLSIKQVFCIRFAPSLHP